MTSGQGGWQPGDPLYADERVCTHPQAVQWNPDNAVVQCHVCGHVYVPRATAVDEVQPHSFHLLEAVNRERERANRLQLAMDELERAHPHA